MSGTGDTRHSLRGFSSPWRLVGFALLVLCAWLSAMPVEGQTSSEPEQPSLTQLLQTSEESLTTLGARLIARRQQVETLQNSLQLARQKIENLRQALAESEESSATLETQLAEAQTSVVSLQTALTETSSLLSDASVQYESVSSGWQRYREYARSEYARLTLQRNLWAVGAIGAAVLAVAATVWAAVK